MILYKTNSEIYNIVCLLNICRMLIVRFIILLNFEFKRPKHGCIHTSLFIMVSTPRRMKLMISSSECKLLKLHGPVVVAIALSNKPLIFVYYCKKSISELLDTKISILYFTYLFGQNAVCSGDTLLLFKRKHNLLVNLIKLYRSSKLWIVNLYGPIHIYSYTKCTVRQSILWTLIHRRELYFN